MKIFKASNFVSFFKALGVVGFFLSVFALLGGGWGLVAERDSSVLQMAIGIAILSFLFLLTALIIDKRYSAHLPKPKYSNLHQILSGLSGFAFFLQIVSALFLVFYFIPFINAIYRLLSGEYDFVYNILIYIIGLILYFLCKRFRKKWSIQS